MVRESPALRTRCARVLLTSLLAAPLAVGGTARALAAGASLKLGATTAAPGTTMNRVSGSGFGKSESVGIRLDSAGGPLLTTFTTTAAGGWKAGQVPIPSPLPGGKHTLYAIGSVSRLTATASLTVVPKGSLTPMAVHAGDVSAFSGAGFVPGEIVSTSFPGGSPVTAAADGTGSVTMSLVSPPEPAGGGVVTGSAPSGVATAAFTVLQSVTVPATIGPTGPLPVSVTGYSASESVNVSLDAGSVLARFVADGSGSASGTVALHTTFGDHTVTATGAISGVTKTVSLSVPGILVLSPAEGLVGTVVSYSSTGGWVPGESVQLWLGSTALQSVVADPAGSASGTFTIPQRQAGSVTIKLTDTVLGVSATASFDVLAPQCDPNFVPPDAPDLATRMTQCPDGTTFTFAPGLYRITAQLPLGVGDTMTGAGSGPGGTEFRGSIVMPSDSFVPSGGMWVHTGDAQSMGTIPDPCAPGVEGCGYLDSVYLDGAFLQRRLSPCTVLSPDQFCIDYAADEISLGQDPTGHVVEYTTVLTMLASGTRYPGVTVRALAYSEFGSGGGPIAASTGWVIDGVRGYENHGCGVAALGALASSPAIIENSQFDHNGYHGVCDYPAGANILNNDIGSNNVFFAHGTGIKLHGSSGLIQANVIHDNNGVGIGFGFQGTSNPTDGEQVIGNTISDNAGQGLQMANTCNDLIQGNIVSGNGGSQLDVSDSNGDTFSNNTVVVPPTSSSAGIRIFGDTAAGPTTVCGAWNDARNNQVTGNDITMGAVTAQGTNGNVNGTVSVPGGLVSGELFSGNAYHVPGGDCTPTIWVWWDGSSQQQYDFSGWRSNDGQDPPPATCGS